MECNNKKGKKTAKKTQLKNKEPIIDTNQFSTLQNMVEDMVEVTKLFCEAAEKQNKVMRRKSRNEKKMISNYVMQIMCR